MGTAGLIRRLLPERADEFAVEVIPPADGLDVFEVETVGRRVVLRGPNGVAHASALRWYLTVACEREITWDTREIALPARLPTVARTRATTPYARRYHLNYCTFSYTMPFWDWARWEREIDWMAMHGINTPLAITGQEAVWQAVYRDLGLSDTRIRAFLGGPAYLPFTWMGCLNTWGGPLPQAWIDTHAQLGRRILLRQRELGMTPALQGFSGHVPAELAGRDAQVLRWWDFKTHLLEPLDPLFARIGQAFMAEQIRVFGTDHLYAADPFIEAVPRRGDPEHLALLARSIHAVMTAADAEAVWVLQAWPFLYRKRSWTPERVKAFLDAVPDDRMLVLDLWAEQKPVWPSTQAFHGKPWVWCMLHNFGGRPGPHGRLRGIAADLGDLLSNPGRGRLSGLGLAMEAIETEPVVYEFLADAVWANPPPEPRAWIRDYARRRYGRRDPDLERAWRLLYDAVYSVAAAPERQWSIVLTRPELPDRGPRSRGRAATRLAPLVEAWELMMAGGDETLARGPFGRDLVDVAAHALTLYAYALHTQAVAAYRAGGLHAFSHGSDAFLDLLSDLDSLLATREEYLLGRWLDAARRHGQDDDERRLYEWNARRLITLWADRDSGLHDYSGRHWSGLIGGFYLPRWRRWAEHLSQALTGTAPHDADGFREELLRWEDAWTRASDAYPTEPRGNPRAVAESLWRAHRPGLSALARGRDAPP